MRRYLFLLLFCLISLPILVKAQSTPNLGRSTSFAVLGNSFVNNTGTTGVTGDLGVTPNGIYQDQGELLVRGTKHIGASLTLDALQDAKTVYEYYRSLPSSSFTGPGLVTNGSTPGIYRNSGDVDIDGIVVLDAKGDINAKFVFIVDGNLTTPSITPPAPGTGLLLQNGAQPQNIFWIVKGKVNLGSSTNFQGNIICMGNITLKPSVNLIGRAISLEGGVSLNTNNVFLPSVVLADLSVDKSAPAGEYLIGDEITYTITAKNAGPSTAYGVVVRETIPAELEFVKVESASKGTYDPTTNEWSINELGLNEQATLKLTFKIIGSGKIINKVSIGSSNPDPKPGDNETEEPVDVPAKSADLSVIKTANSGPHEVGGEIIYTITAKNEGPYPAGDVLVTEVLPNGLELISYVVSKGTYEPSTGEFKVGALAKGESATLTITAKILQAGKIENSANIGSNTPDPNPGNNRDIVVVDPNCPVPSLSLNGGSSQCAESTNVTYTVTKVFGATYNFELTGGISEVSRSENSITVNIGNTSGKIKATVTDLCGKSYTVEQEVSVITKPATPTISGSPSVCANSSQNTYTIQNPSGNATYEWSSDGDIEIIGSKSGSSVTVSTGTNGGTLTVVAKNDCFTSEAASISISTIQPPQAPATVSGSLSLCEGDEATYTIDTANGATNYEWSVPAGWEIISGQGTTSIKVKAGVTSGEVTVKSKNECGESAGAGINVNVSTKPKTPGAIAGPADACAESEGFTYTINPVDGAEKYTWTVPTGWEIVSGQGTTTITVKAGKAAGSISVKAENKCGSSSPAEMPLTVSTKPEAPTAITGESSGCVGSSLTFIVKGGASDYNWTVPAGWSITGGQGTGTITVKVGEGSGTVEVKATNNCGESAGLSKSVSSNTPPVAPAVISGPSSACVNTSGHTYSISEVPGATGYTWTVPAGWVIESGQGTTSITVKAGTASGDIVVTAKNECGASPAATYKVTASSQPQAPVTINGKSNGCIGETMTYSVEGAPGATYNWTVPETWSISSGQGTSSIKVVVGSGAGNISVTITNVCGTSGASEIAVSPLNNPAKPGAIDGPNATCSTSGNLTYSIAVLTGAESYNWIVPEGWTIVSGQGTLSITVQPGEQGGVISVTATNECGTSGSSSLDITVTPPPAAAVRINDLSSFCDGLKYSVDAVPEATTYTWNIPAGFIIVSGQGTPTITVKREDPNAFGDVTVVTNNGDCASPITSLPIDASILEGELEFPKAFSPNGDGKNDTWVITNLEKYPKNQVIIFNRWGSEVYKQSNYQNNWNGNSLEQGTYYYKVSVTMCDGADKVFTGYVTIFR